MISGIRHQFLQVTLAVGSFDQRQTSFLRMTDPSALRRVNNDSQVAILHPWALPWLTFVAAGWSVDMFAMTGFHCNTGMMHSKRWLLSIVSWLRHQMDAFSSLLAICAGNSPVTGEFPAQRPVTRSFDFFYLICTRINGWVNHRESGDLTSLWRHRNVADTLFVDIGI